MSIYDKVIDVSSSLSLKGVSYCFGGSIAAIMNGVPLGREPGDIDLIVAEKDVKKVFGTFSHGKFEGISGDGRIQIVNAWGARGPSIDIFVAGRHFAPGFDFGTDVSIERIRGYTFPYASLDYLKKQRDLLIKNVGNRHNAVLRNKTAYDRTPVKSHFSRIITDLDQRAPIVKYTDPFSTPPDSP